ncbi:MAG: site-specific DNA-methyltransferase [Phycisphaerales bacterium]|nr:site-specific DNA-methyltransferase [Phycisphaerales bacterium]
MKHRSAPHGDGVHHTDALRGLASLKPDSVDLILTDPPYGIASKQRLVVRNGRIVSTQDSFGAWDTFARGDHEQLILNVLAESFRVLKPGGALVMFLSREDQGYFLRKAMDKGFVYRNHIVLVRKSPLPSFTKRNWRSGFEICFYVIKPQEPRNHRPRVFNFLSQAECNNVMSFASTHKKTDHPTEKPLDCIRRIVEVCSNPGDLVVDPFAGSGTTLVAAKQSGRRYLGFDTNAGYVRMMKDRLDATLPANALNSVGAHAEAA